MSNAESTVTRFFVTYKDLTDDLLYEGDTWQTQSFPTSEEAEVFAADIEQEPEVVAVLRFEGQVEASFYNEGE